ncbi:MAG TPA: metal transporter, partial [Candidatus Thermoplasmatota archaeon]|nr:metal transporter [Candidatus Thermoplasmatota archaeon]
MNGRTAAWLAAPLVLLALLVGGLLVLDPAARFQTAAPPVEDIAFERVELEPGLITLHVRNAAAASNTIEQVLVDDAYWRFDMDPPSRTLGRYQSGVLTLEYPWVEGEAHVVKLLTSTGTAFEHEIPVAVATPQPTARAYGDYALIGVLVGVLPVAAGMAFFPLLRRAAGAHHDAVLALTLGVLAFLAIDTVFE